MTSPANEERRRHERRGQVPVDYQVDHDPQPRRAMTQNISVGGAFVLTEDPAEQGQQMTLVIHVPGRTINVRAEVRWTSRFRHAPGMGLQFLARTPELDEFLATLE